MQLKNKDYQLRLRKDKMEKSKYLKEAERMLRDIGERERIFAKEDYEELIGPLFNLDKEEHAVDVTVITRRGDVTKLVIECVRIRPVFMFRSSDLLYNNSNSVARAESINTVGSMSAQNIYVHDSPIGLNLNRQYDTDYGGHWQIVREGAPLPTVESCNRRVREALQLISSRAMNEELSNEEVVSRLRETMDRLEQDNIVRNARVEFTPSDGFVETQIRRFTVKYLPVAHNATRQTIGFSLY